MYIDLYYPNLQKMYIVVWEYVVMKAFSIYTFYLTLHKHPKLTTILRHPLNALEEPTHLITKEKHPTTDKMF